MSPRFVVFVVALVSAVSSAQALTASISSKTNISCNGGSNGTATVQASGGTAPYTYAWSPSGGTNATATGLAAGTYTVTVRDNVGATATAQAILTQPTPLDVQPLSQTNISCFGGNNGAASVTAVGGTTAYSYDWTPGNPTGDGTSFVSGLSAGTYTATVTDANGCTASRSFTIVQPTALNVQRLSQTNISCFGGNNGAASIVVTGGVTAYSYNWTPGNPTGDGTSSVSGLSAGTYTATVTDANSCTASYTFNIAQPSAPVGGFTVVTNVACNGGSNGAIDLTPTGGVGPYTYSWGGGVTTQDRTNLAAGIYTATITDVNSCTGTVSATVTQPTAITLSGSQANISCNGGSNGTATVTATGGTPAYTYAWSPGGGTSATATGRSAGTYVVTVTDANSCTAMRSFTLTEPTALQATASTTNVSCFGGSNGTATVTGTGGAPAYTYSWSPRGGTQATATGLSAGTYTVTMTDANGCTLARPVTVTQPSTPVSGSVVTTNVACRGGSTGAVNLTPAGGVAPYTFDWGGGVTTEDRTGLPAGSYSAIVTDDNGCTATVPATVTQPATSVGGSIVATNVSCNGGSNGALNLTPSGGTAPYTFAWGGGVTTEDRTGVPAGTYAVTVTDANACSATVNATVTAPPALVLNASKQDSCPGASTGTASVSASGGTGTYSYDWSPGMPAGDGTASVSALASGAWSVTVSDENGCSASATATVADLTSLPQAQAQSLTTQEDTALPLTLGVTSACSAMTFTVTTPPLHGALTGTAPTLTYTPAANYFGADDFAYTVAGATGTSSAATISIAVTPVNDAPVAVAQTLRTARDTDLPVTLSGTDVEGTSLTFSVATPPQHGALTGTPPALTYAPTTGFVGDDSFTFTALDGTDTSLPGLIAITVEAPDAGVLDAGLLDAGLLDAGVLDAGVPDAGTDDAGAGEVDAGTEVPDAGATTDAGTEPGDAGVIAMMDGGTTPVPEPTTMGCGCTTPPGALLAWSLGLLLLRRRSAR